MSRDGKERVDWAHKIKDRMEVFPLPDAPIRRTWDDVTAVCQMTKTGEKDLFLHGCGSLREGAGVMTCSILIHVHLCKFARLPAPCLRSHFNRSKAPVLAMVVAPSPPQPSPLQCLIIVQRSQNSKYDWDSCVQLDTLSQMYSKCIVAPLMRTPTAMTASNGPLGTETVGGAGVPVRDPRFGEMLPRRSFVVSLGSYICEPAITLKPSP